MHGHPTETKFVGALLFAALAFGVLAMPAPLLGETSDFTAPGRIEGASTTMSIGTAASGIVGAILVQPGIRVHAGQVLVKLDCQSIEADLRARQAQLAAAQAAADRIRNGPRPDEIAVGKAVVGYSKARADEAQKTLERTLALQEGITVTAAHVLEVKRDARIAAAQLEEANARLSLLRAGSREEDIRQSVALRDAAAAEVDEDRARLDQCSIRAPVDGVVVDVFVNSGQYISLAVPQPLLHLVQDGARRVRAEVAMHDLAHVCLSQTATIAIPAIPNAAPIHAAVAAISPAVTTQSATAATADSHDTDVVAVMLNLDGGAPALPLGLPVTVHFESCPSKT